MDESQQRRRRWPWWGIGLVALGGSILLADWLLPGLIWDGSSVLRIALRVVDADMRQPVAGANVEWGSFNPNASDGAIREEDIFRTLSLLLTDEAGRVDFSVGLPAGGRSTFLRRTGSMSTRSTFIRVNAPGNEESLTALNDHVDTHLSIHTRQPKHITIALKNADTNDP